MITPRYYQTDAIDAAINYLKTNKGMPLISMATGTGKSIVIAELIRRIMIPSPNINIIVASHVAELLQQNHNKLKSVWEDAPTGIYSAGLKQKNIAQVTFAGIQSIWTQDIEQPINLLIVDEVHTISRKSQSMWGHFVAGLRLKNPNLRIIGLTATTFRTDSGNLTNGDDAMFDDVCFEYGLGQAIDDGWLCTLIPKRMNTVYDISNVSKLAGEYNLKELEEATNTDDLNESAVLEIIRSGAERKSWLVFCNGVKHSFAVRNKFRAFGVSCETVTGETPDDERADILNRYQRGEIQAVTNNAVWTTGIDIPNVDLIAMMRHTMSGGLLLQMAGRGTRTMIDLSPFTNAIERKKAIAGSIKANCLFLDFAGNIEKHGMLDMIKGKDKKKKGDENPPLKDCPECATIVLANAQHCPDCGHVFQTQEIEKESVLKNSSYDGAVISKQDKREVERVEYMPHNVDKKDKTPCMCVVYHHSNGKNTKEYVCVMHEGFAKSKAKAWWKLRGGDDFAIDNYSLDMIVNSAENTLKVPAAISVIKDGNFDKITNYDFTAKRVLPKTEDIEQFDIPF